MGVVAAVVLVGGCGTTTSTQGSARSTPATESTPATGSTAATATGPAGETTNTAPPAEEANHEGPGTVPNETNLQLGVAERNLRLKHVPYRVVPRAPSAAGVKATWLVCESNPAPRSHLESGTVVRLIVAASCQ
jgi:hypothetical protein